jgi:dihydroceramide fatty acyl 2-hydroxylase
MFRIDWLERYFSRVRPWQVVAIWVPVAFAAAAWSGRAPGGGPHRAALLGAAGLAGWTLLEYLLHRFTFHFEPDPASELQRDLAWLIHGVHHDYPHDADRLVMPPAATALVSVPVLGLLWAAFGPRDAAGLYSGLTLGYVAYDLTHYWVHHGVPKSRAGRWLRRYHLAHHFREKEAAYGITSPLWDLIFRTYPAQQRTGSTAPLES